ncbi:bifunctional 3-phenylpropionate/cinnamic acid dioxygenase ferredoxin subunit [Nocardioides sp. CFH 31398]|uniref:bifunctional 3-phenylpropionate/cinnamic acid dioxygenase ferredoxin subunit n=1 Tax=Nocardioides sp. CFH 31398 TaxID=2919579 RepID=UPI001F05ED35|nr:bifunctional 3-phenylpropionate/cinnamic acid dioxygenase ferredoxin subunit [Nocardioides sp. CFH 31398]MCH1866053.1 bifunctional 3-phenylpropionate/cinnamic acid dioxygenase ferredoxin subunit [Nocardioides sp. CFH 31398]
MHHLCALDDVVPGEGLRVTTTSPPVAVFRTEDDDVYVVDDTCTHQDASLADGYLEGCWVECPLHESRFDLRTGAVDQPPAKKPVRTHAAKVVDGQVWAELSTDAPNLPPGVAAGVAGGAPS